MPEQPVIIQNPGMVATAGETAKEVIVSLGAQPVLLLVLLLNMCMIGAAAWFLLAQEEYRHEERKEIIKLFSVCMGEEANANRQGDRPIAPQLNPQ